MVFAYVFITGWMLTLINIDSLINLKKFCSSLPTMLKYATIKNIGKKYGIEVHFRSGQDPER